MWGKGDILGTDGVERTFRLTLVPTCVQDSHGTGDRLGRGVRLNGLWWGSPFKTPDPVPPRSRASWTSYMVDPRENFSLLYFNVSVSVHVLKPSPSTSLPRTPTRRQPTRVPRSPTGTNVNGRPERTSRPQPRQDTSLSHALRQSWSGPKRVDFRVHTTLRTCIPLDSGVGIFFGVGVVSRDHDPSSGPTSDLDS